MPDSDLFEFGKIRSLWYDLNGLLKAVVPSRRIGKRKLRNAAAAVVLAAASLVSFNATAKAFTVGLPTQFTLEWPAPPAAAYTKQSLSDALYAIRRAGADWNGTALTEPVSKSVIAAETILKQLPNFVADATAGVDGDGNVYFRLKQGERIAYLTIEPKLIHLLIVEPGRPNVYIDDEQFKGKVLPARIRDVLTEKMAS